MLDKEAMQQTTATHVAANEIEKLTNERADFERELDIQVGQLYIVTMLLLFLLFKRIHFNHSINPDVCKISANDKDFLIG